MGVNRAGLREALSGDAFARTERGTRQKCDLDENFAGRGDQCLILYRFVIKLRLAGRSRGLANNCAARPHGQRVRLEGIESGRTQEAVYW